jgi:alginate O-acetyltransferase complex protein AlgI
MSYVVDIYRGTMSACRSLWRFSIFVMFFPEFVAGPIVRASVFLPQLDRRLQLSWARAPGAIAVILIGLTKKVLIADRLAVFVDPVFAQPDAFSGITVLSAVVAYSIQIYADFSGYTDMAIGIARLIGFDLPENFNMPYIATSITDFWRRWHITLSEWLRDYLYIPLGGNRHGAQRTLASLFITMVLGGLWHGAAWNFVLWGALHGIALAVHKRWLKLKSSLPRPPASIATPTSWLTTYAFVCLTWIFFRAPTLDIAMTILAQIVSAASSGVVWFFLPLWLLLILIVCGHVVGTRAARQPGLAHTETGIPSDRSQWLHRLVPSSPFVRAFALMSWLILLFLLAPVRRSPFIYFQF